MQGNYRIDEIDFVLENAMTKGKSGCFRPRKKDCFVFVLEGMTTYTFSDTSFTVKKGQILYIAKGSVYGMDILTDRYEFIFVDFSFSDAGADTRKSGVFNVSHKAVAEGLFRQLLNVWIDRGKRAEAECLSCLYAIYAKLVQDDGVYTPEYKKEKIKPAAEYILNHYEENLSGCRFGKMCKITETYFRKLFKAVYGMSPVQYINEIRIDRARGLIANSNLSLAEIAGKVGFSDAYYFSRVFKKNTGVSPSSYKKMYSQPEESEQE